MSAYPTVTKLPSGFIMFRGTPESYRVANRPRPKDAVPCLTSEQVHQQAVKTATERGMVSPDSCLLRSLYQIQFGKYRGQTFYWIARNDMGWATYLVCEVDREGGNVGKSDLNDNKREFQVSTIKF